MQNQKLKQQAVYKLSRGETLTFEEAVQYLFEVLPSGSQEIFKSGAGLVRAKYLYNDMLGRPQEQYKTIHVAGTSGKGSVSHILSHLLTHHGFKVGTFISPHVYDIRERILVNTKMISREEFANIASSTFSYALAMQQSRHGQASIFEALNGMAFRVFAEQHVDYAVVETGLGGLYDSSNTIERSDKLALITALGLDHVAILGDTTGEIAMQKAGIFPWSGKALAWLPEDSDAKRSLDHTAQKRQTELSYVDSKNISDVTATRYGVTFDYHSQDHAIRALHLTLHGAHQAQNAALALRALEELASRDGFTVSIQAIREALAHISIPGRFEQASFSGKKVILDGAHNPQKVAAFTSALADAGIQKAQWVFALKQSKDAFQVLQTIAPFVDTLHLTSFSDGGRDMAIFTATPPDELAAIAKSCGIQNVIVHPNSQEALRTACERANETPVVVCGSFYLLADLHHMFRAASRV